MAAYDQKELEKWKKALQNIESYESSTNTKLMLNPNHAKLMVTQSFVYICLYLMDLKPCHLT